MVLMAVGSVVIEVGDGCAVPAVVGLCAAGDGVVGLLCFVLSIRLVSFDDFTTA